MIDCQIHKTVQSGVLRLDAIVGSRASSQGLYRFNVVKNASSGSSQNVQSGEFALERGQSSILTTVVLDDSAVGHYTATLVIESQSGSITCVSP